MNKNNSKTIRNKIGCALVPALITAAIVGIIFIAKGIWPFGEGRIDYYDNMQQVAPVYTHLWDFLHGEASLYFDWTTGLGTNLSMTMSAFSMLSPFNLLLYFVPRSHVLEFISIMTLVKMAFMAFTMYIFLNEKFKTPYPLKVFWSTAYSMCGFVLLYGSCFTPWMEALVFLPLTMLALDKLMKKDKKLFFIFMIALSYIVNYYTATMSLLYIFLVSGAYILFLIPKQERKKKAWNLGIGTIAGMGLSAFVLLPVFSQLSSSQRGSTGGGLLEQYLNILNATVPLGDMSLFQKWMMIYGTALAIMVIFIGIRKFRREKNKNRFVLCILFFILSPLILESIDLIWHFGSYNGYSARFGFLIGFTLMAAGCYYSGKLFSMEDSPGRTKGIILGVISVVLSITAICIYNVLPINNSYIALAFFGIVFVIILAVHFLLYYKLGKNLNYGTFLMIASVELILGAYALIGPPKFYEYYPYQHGDYVQMAQYVKENLDIKESDTERIKNPDVSLNANYPLILNRAGLSSFTAALQSDTQDNARKWGYSKYFLWLLDSGGTLFSDALLGVTESVNVNALDPNYYTLEKESGEYKLYENKYTLPFVMTIGSDITEINMEKANWISLHNDLYTALSGDKSLLVDFINLVKVQPDDHTVQYKGYIQDRSAVYMNIIDINNIYGDANSSWLFNAIQIFVNGSKITIPTIGDPTNDKYFNDHNNNLVYLGTFENEEVQIRIVYDDPWFLKVSQISLAQLNVNKLENLCTSLEKMDAGEKTGKNTLAFTVNGTKEKDMAIIPVVYNPSWTVTVNEKVVDSTQVAGMFTGIGLNNGENRIEMTFVPKGYKAGQMLSLGMLLLIIVTSLVAVRLRSKESGERGAEIPAFVLQCADKIFSVMWWAAIVLCFIIPIVYGVIIRIINLIRMIF